MIDRLPEALVLDTDVVSFLFDQDPIRGPRYRAITAHRTAYLPFVVLGELLYRVEHRHWGPARRARLDEFLADYVVVQSAPDIIRIWAALRAESGRSGHVIERQDAWVAAVALTLDLPLVTHNTAHFEHVPLLRIITEPDR
jgi:predicted nucleic acid-binding protein